MATAASLVSGFEIVVGYCGQTTAKIGLVSLQGGTPSVSFTGGSVAVGAWTEMGADNSGRSGLYVCTTALVTITGLTAWTVYSGSVTCDGITREFSFRTLPADSDTPYTFVMWDCERHIGKVHIGDAGFRKVRSLVETNDPPVAFAAIIDDVHYPSIMDGSTLDDSAIGIAMTGIPETTGLEWDYSAAWIAWFGLVPNMPTTLHANRLWTLRNVAHWCQWGDNDIAQNHCRDTTKACRGAFWTPGKKAWEQFIFNACSPPTSTADGGPSTDSSAYYWGCDVGPVRFFAPDVNSYMTGFNDASPILFGTTQVSDLKTFMGASTQPINIFFSPMGIAKQNETYQKWGTEWNDFIGGASTGLLQSAYLNGTSGVMVALKGDTHNMRVVKFQADGTGTGLGGTTLTNSAILYEVGAGTISGSGCHDAVPFDEAWNQNGTMLFERYGSPDSITRGWCSSLVIGEVQATASPKSIKITLFDAAGQIIGWHGTFAPGSNEPVNPATTVGIS